MMAFSLDQSGQSLLSHVVMAIVIGLFTAWIVRSARREAKRNRNGDYVLAHGLPGKVAVGFVWVMGAVVSVAFYLKQPDSPAWMVFAASTMAFGGLLYAVIFQSAIEFDALDIRPRMPWGRSRVIPWTSVRTVEQIRGGGYRVKTEGGGKLMVNPHFSGLNTFVAEAERHGIAVVPLAG